jgi:hypothetical protein
VKPQYLPGAPLFFLFLHGYNRRGTLSRANTAPLTPEQIGFKMAVTVLFDAAFGAEKLAHTALYTPVEIVGGYLRAPVTGLVLPGISRLDNYGTNLYVFPG